MSGRYVLTAGSVLRGDDAAGPMLAKMLTENPVEGWTAIDGGQTPEDDIAVLRKAQPDEILFVDASIMGLEVGEIRQLTEDDVATQFLVTTHSLPMNFLLSQLREICPNICFLGIQSGSLDFFDPLSPQVEEALNKIVDCLIHGGDFSVFEDV